MLWIETLLTGNIRSRTQVLEYRHNILARFNVPNVNSGQRDEARDGLGRPDNSEMAEEEKTQAHQHAPSQYRQVRDPHHRHSLATAVITRDICT